MGRPLTQLQKARNEYAAACRRHAGDTRHPDVIEARARLAWIKAAAATARERGAREAAEQVRRAAVEAEASPVPE